MNSNYNASLIISNVFIAASFLAEKTSVFLILTVFALIWFTKALIEFMLEIKERQHDELILRMINHKYQMEKRGRKK